jgi:hypothetical protein
MEFNTTGEHMKLAALQLTLCTAALAVTACSTCYAQVPTGRTAAAPAAEKPVQLPAASAVLSTNNLIVRTPVDLSVANAIVADGAGVDLKATLRSKSTNAPLGDKTIEFKIDGKMAAIIKTDASGLAWVKGHKAPSDMSAGAHVLEAHFPGNDSLVPAKSTANFALFAAKTSIESSVYTYYAQTDVWNIHAALIRETDKASLGDIKNAHLLIDGTEVSTTKQGFTDNSVDLRFKLPAGKHGDVTAKIVFDGTGKLLPTASSVMTIKAPDAPTAPTPVAMTVEPMPAISGRVYSCNESLMLVASVKSMLTQAPMKDVAVKFGLSGGVYHSKNDPGSGLGGHFEGGAVTNANGIAILNAVIPSWACPGSDGQTAYNRQYRATATVEPGVAGPYGSTIMGGAMGSAIGSTIFLTQR